MMPPAKNRVPIRKAVLTMFAPRLVSLRKVSFTLKARYSTTAEKKIKSSTSVNTIAMMVKLKSILLPLGFVPLRHGVYNFFS